MIRVCMAGLGRTGKEVAKVLLEQEDVRLVAAICSKGSDKTGRDVGDIIGTRQTGIIMESSDNLEQIVFRCKPDVVVDFSTPQAALRNARIFSRMRVNIVIGTTGFSRLALSKLFILSRRYRNGIVYAPNITLGVNVLMLLTNLASSILNNYDFQVIEMHHKLKKDAPSGTAVKIVKEIENGLTASGSNKRDIPVTAVRAGGVIGKHEVMIIGDEDRIEISHESFSRRTFALGALRAVRFINKRSGYFEMSDVLNLKEALAAYLEKEDTKKAKRKMHYLKYENPFEEIKYSINDLS